MDSVVEANRESSLGPVVENPRKLWSWAFLDWANSSFATTVMAGFFPLFFKQYWSHGLAATESTFALGIANSVSSIGLGLIAPILGSIADQGGFKKWMLGFFTGVGVISTAGLFFVDLGDYQSAAILYALGALGFYGVNIFYDAFLVHVSSPKKLHFNSGLGFSIGYLGGGLLFAVNVFMFLKPEVFGLSDGPSAIKTSFMTVAVWWTVFTIPFFLLVPEPRRGIKNSAIFEGWKVFLNTLKNIRRFRSLSLFLIAYLFYIDGVNTTVKMAVDYGLALGFESKDLITALLIVQFIGFPTALLMGWLGGKIGARRGIFICLGVYCGVVIFGYFMTEVSQFYLMAAAIGSVQGGIQSLSRSLFGELVPVDQSAEFFGFFNMVGKFSAIFGPLLVGITSQVTGQPRLSILVLLVFFILGGFLLYRTPKIIMTKSS